MGVLKGWQHGSRTPLTNMGMVPTCYTTQKWGHGRGAGGGTKGLCSAYQKAPAHQRVPSSASIAWIVRRGVDRPVIRRTVDQGMQGTDHVRTVSLLGTSNVQPHARACTRMDPLFHTPYSAFMPARVAAVLNEHPTRISKAVGQPKRSCYFIHHVDDEYTVTTKTDEPAGPRPTSIDTRTL